MAEPEFDPYAPARPPTMAELPYEDGEPLESPRHRQQMALLVETLQHHFRDDPEVYIGANMAVYFSAIEKARPAFKAPDFFVVLGAEPGRYRTSWVAWEENSTVPEVIIELLSASTEREDRGRKMSIYGQARVSAYYLYDPHTHVLEGYARDFSGRRWLTLPELEHGGRDCAPLGLTLRVLPGEYQGEQGPWLRWVDADGRVLPTPAEAERERAEAERERAEAERKRADAAEAELARLRALLAARG